MRAVLHRGAMGATMAAFIRELHFILTGSLRSLKLKKLSFAIEILSLHLKKFLK
jgi:hypothetical protein